MKTAKATGVSMLDKKIRMTAPAADSAISSGCERRATSAICTPFQPDTAMPAKAASSKKAQSGQAGVLYVPSKASSYLCAGRAIVIAAPWQNLAATTVKESNGGRVTEADNASEMADAVAALLADDSMRAQMAAQARNYAERMFEISKIAERFERLFERLRTGTPRHRLPQ